MTDKPETDYRSLYEAWLSKVREDFSQKQKEKVEKVVRIEFKSTSAKRK